jgi:hypothetical protein
VKDDGFDHLFPAPKLMYEALHDAGLSAATPQRNVQWVNPADDGVMVFNVWRHSLRKRGNKIHSAFILKSRVEHSPSRKRKRDRLLEVLQQANGATVRVILLDEKIPQSGLVSGNQLDSMMWSVHDLGDRYELRQGGKGSPEYADVPIVPVAFGVIKPKKRMRVSEQIERLGRVKKETLNRAGNKCEIPKCIDGPLFVSPDVHHITRLGDLGSDHTDNTVALCPACHVRVHRGIKSVRIRMEAEIEKIRANRFKGKRG